MHLGLLQPHFPVGIFVSIGSPFLLSPSWTRKYMFFNTHHWATTVKTANDTLEHWFCDRTWGWVTHVLLCLSFPSTLFHSPLLPSAPLGSPPLYSTPLGSPRLPSAPLHSPSLLLLFCKDSVAVICTCHVWYSNQLGNRNVTCPAV